MKNWTARQKYQINAIKEDIQQYAERYKCSIIESVHDLDYPVEINMLREVFNLLNVPVSEEQLSKLGYAEELVRQFEKEDQGE